MRSLLARMRRHKLLSVLAIVLAAGALVGGMVVATEATSKPAFCDSCHEMTPYYTAWSAGTHASVDCVTCHVDPGLAAQVSHKFVALQEVYVHLTGEPRFPGNAEVPDSRCTSCHDGEIDPGIPGFDHQTHSAEKACISCHDGVGHTVSSAALADAGILDPEAFAQREATKVAEVGDGKANLEGHSSVVCSTCHDLAATGCSSCHTTPDDHRSDVQDCLTCHATGAAWEFDHPASTECVTCHISPEDHYGTTCLECHSPNTPFAATVFAHPTDAAECADCHDRPAQHSVQACVTCHETGVSWSFAHPSSSSTCLNCHTRPSGHSQSSCVTCHQTGVSWRFVHPSSTSCASCHSAPSNHYGTSCVSCHSPSSAWSSATFAHPQIPGGEHTYRSFACSSCHPAGYSTYSCLQCHSSNNPD